MQRRAVGRALAITVVGAGALLGALPGAVPHALAQAAFPSKPLRIVVTFPPGASSDAVVRIVAPRLSEQLGQPVIVENKPGAGGNIGLASVVQSPADGYTLGVGAAGSLAANASLYAKMPFDPAKDLVPVSLLAHIPFVLVAHPGLGVASFAELSARARAGGLSIGHGGNGTAMHLSVELLNQQARLGISQVAYRGTGPAMVDVLGGHIPLAMLDLPSALAQIKSGKLRALAVTSATRSSFLPEVPTLAEAGVAGYESTGWFGVVVPSGTPGPVVNRLQAALAAVLSDPQAGSAAAAVGVELTPTTAAEFAGFIRSETQKWAAVIKSAGIRLE